MRIKVICAELTRTKITYTETGQNKTQGLAQFTPTSEIKKTATKRQ